MRPKFWKRSSLRKNAHLSFSGCGFLGIYHVGVASAFREYAPDIVANKVVGASSGALTACCLVNRLPFDVAVTSILRMATQSRRRALGPFHPTFNINDILFEDLEKMLPSDAHIRSDGKLFISVTKSSSLENQVISRYSTREELILTLMASCFIPVFSGYIPPKIRGERFIDGGFSCNLKVFDDNTITVSPFSGESDICPRDESFQLSCVQISNTSLSVSPANLYRMQRILFAPHPDVLARMCQQGFDDAIKYLRRHQLISCVRCLAVESTLLLPAVQTPHEEHETKHGTGGERDGDCAECDVVNQIAQLSSLPEKVQKPCKDAAEALERSLYHWLFKTRTMKTVALITAPVLLPLDIAYITLRKLRESFAPLRAQLRETISRTISSKLLELKNALGLTESRAQIGTGSGHLSYQLAIHEYESIEPRRRAYTMDTSKGSKIARAKRKSFAGIEKRLVSELNLGFAVDMEDETMSKTSTLLKTMDSTENLPSVADAVSLTNGALQRNAPQSRGINAIVNVTRQKDPLMKFFYTDDETNSVRVTEIFDLSRI
ncbi:patatin-like phospholipase domain-containing protein 2 [Galendromus occidentalis]|uniref:Patatin-like phospholipase domain-containing protein 2 n=1 Tax=Galendromus occidentalis TaxID=34638 RepID=A0AAJ6VXJ4_9ACAR|nr:patatin-like phospholipase domain-containing protein 2 [Galendromus occidentalis]